MLPQGNSGYDYYVNSVDVVLNGILPTLIGIVVLIFVWGVIKCLWAWEHEKERERGKKLMLFAVWSIFLLTVVYGIISAATTKIDSYVNDTGEVVGGNATTTDVTQ